MSSLSNQKPGSPFSEYPELCKLPPLPPPVLSPSWDWQRPSGVDNLRGLVVGGGALVPTGLTDEDKLFLYEQPGRSSVDAELGVPEGGGSKTSLGSAGESPDSPLTSSAFPSPLSPARLPSTLGCVDTSKVPLPPLCPSPGRSTELWTPTKADMSSPNPCSNSSFPPSSAKVAMPQAAPSYHAAGVGAKHLERGGVLEAGAGTGQLLQGSTGDSSEEEEGKDEDTLREPSFTGRAQQQRKEMRRAMSECSHLSVPPNLELPDKYPSGDGMVLDQLESPICGPRRSPYSMKRSFTVAEDQAPTSPPSLSAAGATHADLRQTPSDPHLYLSPFHNLRGDGGSNSPPSSDVFGVEKEPAGIVLHVPLSPRGFHGDLEHSEAVSKRHMAKDALFDDSESDGEVGGLGNRSAAALDMDDDLNTHLTLNSAPSLPVDGRCCCVSVRANDQTWW